MRAYHALSCHFGPHGDQTVHYHPCIDHERCDHILIGEGRVCGSKKSEHREATLTVKGPKYVKVSAVIQPTTEEGN